MDKAELRRDLRAARKQMRTLVRAQEEDLVNAAIVSDPDWQAARTVLVYKAVGSELSVVSATNEAFRRGVRVAFPRVVPGGLSLHQVADWAQLAPGAHGIPEPPEAAPVVHPADVDVALVPGLGFTANGRRLGQGGGYYDRLLPLLGGVSWAPAYSCQLVDELPTEAHDRPVDRVVWPGDLGL